MSERPQRKPDKREALVGHVVRKGIPILMLVLVAGGAYVFLKHADAGPHHEAAAGSGQPMPVNVYTVQRETVPVRPRYLGRTEGRQTVEIRARVAGYLHERYFEEGTFVHKGDPLFQIDPRPFQNDLAYAKAQLESAQATLERANAQLERYKELTERQSATQGELDEWVQQQGVAAAAVDLAKARIAAAELDIEYASIDAPIDGTIGEALKEVGSYVDSGSNGLMAVVQQVDPIDVVFSITEHDVLERQRRIKAGELAAPPLEDTRVSLTLSDGTVYPQTGKVRFVDVVVDQTTGTMIVRASFPNPDLDLRPGQFAHAELLDNERVGVIRVPQSAVLQNPTGASVYVINAEGKIDARPITLGDWSEGNTWIVERGLEPGDRVVTDRLLMLRPGMPVTIASSTTDATTPTTPTEPGQPGEAKPDAANDSGEENGS